MRKKIDQYKQRNERFANDDDKEKRMDKIHRMEKKLEWTEHKAPPLPIMQGSEILTDSLYLYGVDFMSTDDVKTYFSRYNKQPEGSEEPNAQLEVKWINDSSCVV